MFADRERYTRRRMAEIYRKSKRQSEIEEQLEREEKEIPKTRNQRFDFNDPFIPKERLNNGILKGRE